MSRTTCAWAAAFWAALLPALLAVISTATVIAYAETPLTPSIMPPRFPTPFRVIAHRGASAYAPENTIAAFERARQLGVVDVELDVQLSKDNVVMLYHDSSLFGKTGHAGSVRDYDASALQKMDIGNWFDRTHPEIREKFATTTLDTLDALFKTFGDQFRYHVELKSEDLELAHLTLACIRANGLETHVRFTSFIFDQVARAHEIAPKIPTDLLVRDAKQLRGDAKLGAAASLLPLQIVEVDRAVTAGFDQVGFAAEDLSRELVEYAIDRGLEIRAWRIQSDEDMRRAIDFGAYGMTTNWPDRLIRELLLHKRTLATR